MNNFTQLALAKHLGKAHNTEVMDQHLENDDFGLKDANGKILKDKAGSFIKSNKCNQCEYASSREGSLRTHLKTYSGEKSNKSSQCDPSSLRRHTKMHIYVCRQSGT